MSKVKVLSINFSVELHGSSCITFLLQPPDCARLLRCFSAWRAIDLPVGIHLHRQLYIDFCYHYITVGIRFLDSQERVWKIVGWSSLVE